MSDDEAFDVYGHYPTAKEEFWSGHLVKMFENEAGADNEEMEPTPYAVNDVIVALSHYIEISASRSSLLRWKYPPEKFVGSWIQLEKKNKKGFSIFLVTGYEDPAHKIEGYGLRNFYAWVDLTTCSIEQIRQQGGPYLVQMKDETEQELQWLGGRQTNLLVAPGFADMRKRKIVHGLRMQRSTWSPTELGPSFLRQREEDMPKSQCGNIPDDKQNDERKREIVQGLRMQRRLLSPTESFRFIRSREEDISNSQCENITDVDAQSDKFSEDSPVVADSEQDKEDKAIARYLVHAGIGKHTFWESQPVEQIGSILDPSLIDGPIQPERSLSLIKKKSQKIGAGYEWTTLDLNSDAVCSEVCKLFMEHDKEGYRDANPRHYLRWVLQPPGYYQSWHVGIRVKNNLVALLCGVPAKIRLGANEAVKVAAISLLYVQKEFRSKRLVPFMIEEMVRRANLKDVWQGLFTSSFKVAAPVTTIIHWIRVLNPGTVLKFSNGAQWIKDATTLPNARETPGFRKMEQSDVPAVTELLRGYLLQFPVAAEFREEDVKHWLLPKKDVVDCYVVEDPETHVVTDMCSFYTTVLTVGGRNKYHMKMACSYYNVATKTPFNQLMKDTLITCRQNECDIFQAKDVMENETIFKELEFEKLPAENYFYLFNQRLRTGLQPCQLGVIPF